MDDKEKVDNQDIQGMLKRLLSAGLLAYAAPHVYYIGGFGIQQSGVARQNTDQQELRIEETLFRV